VQLSTTRQLSETISGEYTWVIGPPEAAGMSLGLTRRTEKTLLAGRLEVGGWLEGGRESGRQAAAAAAWACGHVGRAGRGVEASTPHKQQQLLLLLLFPLAPWAVAPGPEPCRCWNGWARA
jgi:hypothetical protein